MNSQYLGRGWVWELCEWAGGSECEQLVAFCGVLTNEFCWAVLGVDTKSALTSPLSSPSQPSPREPQTSAERAC